MIRADALLSKLNIASRKESKKLFKQNRIFINDILCNNPNQKFEESNLKVTFNNKEYFYKEYQYYMLNKPSSCVSATVDNTSKTVLEVFKDAYIEENGDLTGVDFYNLFPVGRLDKDTVGLLILTNDGDFAHKTLSPKNHVEKEYYVKTDLELSKEDINHLEEGVYIEKDTLSKPAKITVVDSNSYYITICEGKFHQVKNMFKAVNKNVLYLRRIRFGNIVLDDKLKEGSYRELTELEIDGINNIND